MPSSFGSRSLFDRMLGVNSLGVMFAALLAASAFPMSLRAQESKPPEKPAEALPRHPRKNRRLPITP